MRGHAERLEIRSLISKATNQAFVSIEAECVEKKLALSPIGAILSQLINQSRFRWHHIVDVSSKRPLTQSVTIINENERTGNPVTHSRRTPGIRAHATVARRRRAL